MKLAISMLNFCIIDIVDLYAHITRSCKGYINIYKQWYPHLMLPYLTGIWIRHDEVGIITPEIRKSKAIQLTEPRLCLDAFLSIKNKTEKHIINFKYGNSEVYNKLFCVEELGDTLDRSHDSDVGPDNIHYQLLKQLPESCLFILLNIFNQI